MDRLGASSAQSLSQGSYLDVHRVLIEEALGDAVADVAIEQPLDPLAFIGRKLVGPKETSVIADLCERIEQKHHSELNEDPELWAAIMGGGAADAARRFLHNALKETMEHHDTDLACIQDAVAMALRCGNMANNWPQALQGLADLLSCSIEKLLCMTEVDLSCKDVCSVPLASSSPSRSASDSTSAPASPFRADSTSSPGATPPRRRKSSSMLLQAGMSCPLSVGGCALLCLSMPLAQMRLQGTHLSAAVATALVTALRQRARPILISLGFNSMPCELALELAGDLLELPEVRLHDYSGNQLHTADQVGALLQEQPAEWLSQPLFCELLRRCMGDTPGDALQADEQPLSLRGAPDKFTTNPKFFVFADPRFFRDGLPGLYKAKEIDPDTLHRSIRQEFEACENGRWLPELRYVVEEEAVEQYPSSKGKSPVGQPWLEAAYTRDYRRAGKRLEDFWREQPALSRRGKSGEGDSEHELTMAEVATLRLYSGPLYKPWNDWLRWGEEGDSTWATSLAVLYTAVLKLSHDTKSATVFRAVKESALELPESFLRAGQGVLSGGVEKGFMSSSKEVSTACSYSGRADEAASIFQMKFDLASRGADLHWVSQFPEEHELLYPPCTSLTVVGEQQVGACRRVLHVQATVSTLRPNVDWCTDVDTVPPEEGRARMPTSGEVGPFEVLQVVQSSLESVAFRVELREAMTGGVYRMSDDEMALEGKLSPLHVITLGEKDRHPAGVPQGAAYFAFAYPANSLSQASVANLKRTPNALPFAMGGGFVCALRGSSRPIACLPTPPNSTFLPPPIPYGPRSRSHSIGDDTTSRPPLISQSYSRALPALTLSRLPF